MRNFKFILMVHAERVAEREEQLPDVNAAEIFGRGLLANIEEARLSEGAYICIHDEKDKIVMFLNFSNAGLSWKPTLTAIGLQEKPTL